ncbi:MAG: phosphatidyl-myo-inositol alpha-mannosyltransferase [Actinomycetota bacterium]|nr:phosphatidyl-myo-inositol alpha-mannosyltransferase [Actinomycetota bacterium]
MRVGIVCPYDWNTPGGVQAHIRDLAEELMRRGHDVSVLAPAEDDSDLPDYVVGAGRAVAVPYNGSVARLNIGVVSATRVRRWIREGRFDVVHVHEPVSPSLSVLTCWIAQGPIVATQHVSMDRSKTLSSLSLLANTAMEKLSGRIAVSEKARQFMVEHVGGDAVLIPNGVNCEAFATPGELPGYPRQGPTLFFIGRIDEPRKGLPTMLAAMPAIIAAQPDVELLVAGPGEVAEVEETLDPAIADHVRFLGLVSERDKVRAFHSADLYVAPHLGGESFGIVLLEAMASGTPVLASDLEAFRLVLADGRYGELFTTGDVTQLATQVITLLNDPQRREALAAAGHRRAWEYDWGTVARDIERVYASVVTPGEPVTADLSEQLLGRWARRTPRED